MAQKKLIVGPKNNILLDSSQKLKLMFEIKHLATNVTQEPIRSNASPYETFCVDVDLK